jgi:PEP-CTERM motif
MNVIMKMIIGFSMLASSGGAIASLITGTIDGVHSEFYQEDIWQIISDITPDTKAEKRLLSKSDKKFVRKIGKYQKYITKLQNKDKIRELKEKQVNRLLKSEDRLVQLLNSRNLLDRLLLAGLDDPNDFVLNNQTDSGMTDYTSQEPSHETSIPEPSTLILLALGMLCLGVAHSKHAYRPPS